MKLIRLIPWLGHRIERHPRWWGYGTAALVALVLLSKWLNIPFVW